MLHPGGVGGQRGPVAAARRGYRLALALGDGDALPVRADCVRGEGGRGVRGLGFNSRVEGRKLNTIAKVRERGHLKVLGSREATQDVV